MSDVRQWLDALGLAQYAEAFEAHDIDPDLLSELDHATLKDIGVESTGHRLRILKAVAALQTDADSKPSVAGSRPVSSPAAPSSPAHDLAAWERQPGERKPVTMLFADIVGSTAMTEPLDAEDAHDLLYGATQRMCEAVERYRGTVCRFMGDGIMAMFGAPVASEQHAIEACEAALAMQREVSEYQGIQSGLAIRVGLHSGEVVVLTVGDGDKTEYDASGPTVPVAARLEQSAEVGEVLISAPTRRLAGNRIDCEALTPISVKGIAAPLPVFALRRVRTAEESTPGRRTRFVGRRAELNQFAAILSTCMEEARGQTIFVRGEAGIGKTRLVEEFVRIAGDSGVSGHRGLVLEFGAGQGQDAIRSLVRSLLEISLGSSESERRDVAGRALAEGLLDADDEVFLYDLLDLPQSIELRSLYDAMDNEARNRGKQAAVSTLIARRSAERPLVIVIEDVHWADVVVLAHLGSLVETVASCPALLVVTSRAAGDPLGPSWRQQLGGAPLTSIELGPLREADSTSLIGEFMRADDPLTAVCLKRAAGNPLFLEQLLRNATEGLDGVLPDSIQSLILARIDRLDPRDKAAIQAAAVIGQHFELDCLRKVLDSPDYDCRNLVSAHLLRGEGDAFLFAHALIQEGVYEALIRSTKGSLHARAAQWYAERDLPLHAQHLERASDPAAAGAYLSAAGAQAGVYRTLQALDLAERGLAIATEQPGRFALSKLKGELLLDLGRQEAATEAFEAALAQAQENLEKCQALIGIATVSRTTQDSQRAFEALRQAEDLVDAEHHALELARIHHVRGSLLFFTGNAKQCRLEHERALHFAVRARSAELEAQALSGLGDSAYSSGEMDLAQAHWTRCVSIAREHGFGRVEVPNLGMLADVAYFQTELDSAEELVAEAIDLATKTSDVRTECFLRWGLAYVLGERANWPEARRQAQLGLELSRQIGASQFEVGSLIHISLAEREIGSPRIAEDLAKDAVRIIGETGTGFVGAWSMGVLARVSHSPDDVRAALDAGERMLADDCTFFCYLHYCRHAIEACLEQGWWARAAHLCDLLQQFSATRPTTFADFFVARGRALSALATAGRSATLIDKLRRLRDEAARADLRAALPKIEQALAQG